MFYRGSTALSRRVFSTIAATPTTTPKDDNASSKSVSEAKSDPLHKQIFLQKFRERLANDTTGKNSLENFFDLPEGLPPTAAAIGPLKRGEEPLPPWLKLKVAKGISQRPRFNKIRRSMREKRLATVCEEAKCPNIGECWGGDEEEGTATATIMVMGTHCTRGCRFCSVLTSRKPPPLDPQEPEKVADAVSEMGVDYIVMTMVDRDDLPDGGASHVVRCINTIKEKNPKVLLEALVGDFHGDLKLVEMVATSPLSVYAHNIECVERITPNVRDRRASYRQSLKVLEHVNTFTKGEMLTKSSIMLGLGEKEEEVRQTLRDLRTAGVSAVTLGQYLQPARTRLKVSRYAHPKEFEMWEKEALEMGFLYCASGPMVRSSYRAGEYYIKSILKQRQDAAKTVDPLSSTTTTTTTTLSGSSVDSDNKDSGANSTTSLGN
ncbi:putative lipoic acid synthetase, mitochondrial precursor [Trypanosoma theileri]|uniref:Lipoyl synthase, mitochondrial n=1 Tax=Trypanosoma theileri TaxID=67003 RepID=A0A1X0P6C6_9TRYP|nr:putative lipoic acid synthetase, mitochondrial precursor [Trypanosoma theileri]ORC92496.1 putative lipoic acid synthetase, mitochondrial precursor [Trypanosoma theileri]